MPAPTSAISRHASSSGLTLVRRLALALLFALPALAQEAEPASAAQGASQAAYSFTPLDYEPGRGLRFGSSGLSIGGFSTFEIEREDGEPGELALDSINFLVSYEPTDRLHFFAELEVGDLLAWETNQSDVESDPRANFERLYAEYTHSDALNLRFGKFQTPVGRWNLAPAEPFVWTATQPASVELGLDEHQTGVAIYGSFHPKNRVVSYQVFGQVIDAFDVESDESPAERSVGARLEYGDARGNWSFGGAVLANEKDGAWTTQGAVDAKWRATDRLELTSELHVSGGDIPGRDFWGVFVEGAYPLDRLSPKLSRLYLVGRAEHYDAAGERATQVFDFGVTWLPREWLNLKAGYRALTHENGELADGLHVSISVIF
jgi:hypothetical protein